MLFRLLGPVRIAGGAEMQSAARRALLTALLLRRGQFVGMGELTELLWDDPPSSAVANIRSHLTGLRRGLDSAQPGLSERLTTSRGAETGYALSVDADELDLSCFLKLARQGRNCSPRATTGPRSHTWTRPSPSGAARSANGSRPPGGSTRIPWASATPASRPARTSSPPAS